MYTSQTSVVYVLGSREIEAGITVAALPSSNATVSHPRPEGTQKPGAGSARCQGYTPSPWRSTQVQQGSGFLQELKAAIQLNQLECRAGTITWGCQQNNKVHEVLSRRDFCGPRTHYLFCEKNSMLGRGLGGRT